MKTIYYLLFLPFICVNSSFAQDNFTVIKVNGNIIIQRTGTSLDIGSVFPQDENLRFETTESRAAVINPKRGRYLLSSANYNDFVSSKSNFLPAASKITTRGGASLMTIDDLKNHFEGNYVIFDKIKVKIHPALFPMNENHFFYIKYNYKNEDINKKLQFSGDTLIIDKNELFTVDGKRIPNPDIKEMNLMYVEIGEKHISTPICVFNPVYPDFDQLKKEIGIILENSKARPRHEKISEVSSFITDFYGKIEENSLIEWLKTNFAQYFGTE